MKVIPLDKDGKAEVQGSSRTIAVTLNNTNVFRINNDLPLDTPAQRQHFLAYYINDLLRRALDSGELKQEARQWIDAKPL
jgi:hypothetical protein